jgi:antitoxin component of MazEF toxin-antitoxin module
MDIEIDRQGRVRLPERALRMLGVRGGQKIRLRFEGERVVLERIVAVDPFAEAMKKPEADALEKLMDEQDRDRAEAENRFEELLENPPEVKPEDRPDLWR